MKDYNPAVFLQNLQQIDWFQVINTEDMNLAWSKFVHLFNEVIDCVAPIKNVRLKKKFNHWFSGDVLHCIRKRDRAWINFRKTRSNVMFQEYKKLRNKTQRLITKAKKEFVRNTIDENQGCIKKLWKTLKDLGATSKCNSESRIGLKNGDEIEFDGDFVSDKFNNFFCNIASELVEKLPSTPFDIESLNRFYANKGAKANSFKFSTVSENEILKLLVKTCPTKATGSDNINARFVKDGATAIASPVTYLINLSLRLSDVPSALKTAKVIPLFKKENRNYVGNYRPVSILPVFSKLFEKVVYKQFYDYLCKQNLIYKYQSGFRLCFSTETALCYLSDLIRGNMDKGLYTGMVLIAYCLLQSIN